MEFRYIQAQNQNKVAILQLCNPSFVFYFMVPIIMQVNFKITVEV